MKLKAITLSLITLLCISSFVGLSNAAVTETLTASSGDVNIAAGIKVRVTYDADLSINKPDTVLPGENKNWEIQLSGGTLSLSVYIPSPINEWYSVSQSIPIGSYYDVPITSGLSARVKILASTTVNMDGQANVDYSSLTWENEGAKTLAVNVDKNAQPGSSVTITMPFTFDINIGLVVGFWMFEYEVASTGIGHFTTNAISASMVVQSPTNWALIVFGAIIVAVVITVVAYSIRKRGKAKNFDYPPPPPPPPF